MKKILESILEKSPDIKTIKDLLERLKPENIKSGDIIKTSEYVGEVDRVECTDEEYCLKIYFKWAQCTADGSRDCFYEDHMKVLKNDIEILKIHE